MAVYESFYANPDAPYFTRPLREWHEMVEWDGNSIKRFTKIWTNKKSRPVIFFLT